MRARWVKIQDWWLTLADREKKAIILGGSLLIIYIAYQWMLTPYLNSVAALRQRITKQQQELRSMQAMELEIARLQKQVQTKNVSLTPAVILSYLQRKIRQANLQTHTKELKQLTNETIGVRFEQVEFDRLIQLLTQIVKEEHLSILQMSATAQREPGMVNVDIQLGLGSAAT